MKYNDDEPGMWFMADQVKDLIVGNNRLINVKIAIKKDLDVDKFIKELDKWIRKKGYYIEQEECKEGNNGQRNNC